MVLIVAIFLSAAIGLKNFKLDASSDALVIEGDDDALLEPKGRYARMGNVWQLPSPGLTARWLGQAGLSEIEIVDVSVTSLEEQRCTPWMTFHSLEEFLNPCKQRKYTFYCVKISIRAHPPI